MGHGHEARSMGPWGTEHEARSMGPWGTEHEARSMGPWGKGHGANGSGLCRHTVPEPHLSSFIVKTSRSTCIATSLRSKFRVSLVNV